MEVEKKRRRPRRAPEDVRENLVRAAIWGIATHGFVDCTVAQIVSRAKMSRRAFYDHFTDREDCVLAGYEMATDTLLAHMGEARAGENRWPERPLAGLDRCLADCAAWPGLAQAFIVEIQRAGPAADVRRNLVIRRWAEWLSEQSRTDLELPGPAGVRRRPLTVTQALGIIGAHTQMLTDAVASGRAFHDPALRADMAFAELSLATSALPDDLWVS